MPRTGFVFIAICMVLISASASALIVAVAGATLAQAGIVGLGLLLMMVIGHLATQRQRDREEANDHLELVTRHIETLSNDITALAQRIDRFESLAMDKAKLATAPIAAEIDVLGGLVKQFAETLDTHETAIHHATRILGRRQAEAPPIEPPTDDMPPMIAAPPLPEPEMAPEPAIAALPAAPEPPIVAAPVMALLDAIENAAAHGRMDLYLQPVVTLPQRKVRWYEAQTRLRTADGTMIEQNEWRGTAEAVGAHVAIDRQALVRSAQMVRRLVNRMRDAGIIVTLCGASLADPLFAAEIEQYLGNNPSLARIMMLQMSKADFDELGLAERKLLAALMALGYRFAMDRVETLELDGGKMAQRGIKLVKLPARLIVAEAERPGAPKHPADIAADLAKLGVEMVAGDIDEESLVLDLIDFDIPLAQGSLFSTPKAVPNDLLQDEVTLSRAVVEPPAPANMRGAPEQPVLKTGTLGAAVLGSLQNTAPPRGASIGPGLKALIKGRR